MGRIRIFPVLISFQKTARRCDLNETLTRKPIFKVDIPICCASKVSFAHYEVVSVSGKQFMFWKCCCIQRETEKYHGIETVFSYRFGDTD